VPDATQVECRVPRLEESLPVINARDRALGAYLAAAIGRPIEGQHTARMKRL
jgi:hypothetical protein